MKQFLVFSSYNYFIATNSNRSCVIIFVIGCDVAGIFFNDSDFSSLVCLGKQAFKFKIVCTSEYAELLSYEPALILTVFSNETIKFKIHKYVIWNEVQISSYTVSIKFASNSTMKITPANIKKFYTLDCRTLQGQLRLLISFCSFWNI